MKTIVISGACSSVGKTTLANAIHGLFRDSVVVKIGHGDARPGLQNFFYQHGTPFDLIRNNHHTTPFLIIESNSILKEIEPDLAIFLDGASPKPSAKLAESKADLISETRVDAAKITALAHRLVIEPSVMKKIVWLSGARPEPVTALVLAGGKSSRMGQDKTSLEIQGSTLLDRACHSLMPFFDQIIVSAADASVSCPAHCELAVDLASGQGPLMGICSALQKSKNHINFVVACDIPQIHLPTIRGLLSWTDTHDIVMPSFKINTSEPLFAVYTKDVLPIVQQALESGKRRIAEIFPRCKTKILSYEDGGWYFNINTPDDYTHYLKK